jgi:DNA-binding NarL/FixJ family response regulator
MMPGHGGMWALEQLHATLPNVPVMLVTAASSASIVEHGRSLGATGCLDKVGILDHLSELLASVGDGEKRTRVA